MVGYPKPVFAVEILDDSAKCPFPFRQQFAGVVATSVRANRKRCSIAVEQRPVGGFRFARFGIQPLVYSFKDARERVSWAEGKETEGMLRYLSRRKGDSRLNPVTSGDDIRGDDIFYFNCIGRKEDLEGLARTVSESLDMKCIFERETYQTDYWCEIMPAGTSKGAAARVLKELLGAGRLVAFGDGKNDTELCLAADECYAVKNAASVYDDMLEYSVLNFTASDAYKSATGDKAEFAKQLADAIYKIPDILVQEEDGNITVRTNDECYPIIELNQLQVDSASKDTQSYMKTKIKEAKDLIDALEMRKATIKKVGLMIVDYQYDFLTGGEMKPMKLKDIAQELGYAPSTISRAISNKYLECKRGIFPIKSFFTTAIEGDVSNASIKDFLSEIIKSENKKKPLSDIKILTMIEEHFGLKIVRRTITKYRKQLNIASSSERKKLYEMGM